MGFFSQSNQSMADAFVDDELLGEAASYTPYGGSARAINIVCSRSKLTRLDEQPGISTPSARISVVNDAVRGIDPSDRTMIGGAITITPGVNGMPTTTFVIQRDNLISQDDGMLRFVF